MEHEFILSSLTDTDRLGAVLAQSLPDGAVVALVGTLGAGKTRLVQAVATACGIDPTEVTSPTFVLIQEYHGRRSLYHFDLYRLERDAEFLDLGPDEYFEADGLSFVEWADRFDPLLPTDRVLIRIELLSPESRCVRIRATGERYAEFLKELSVLRGG